MVRNFTLFIILFFVSIGGVFSTELGTLIFNRYLAIHTEKSKVDLSSEESAKAFYESAKVDFDNNQIADDTKIVLYNQLLNKLDYANKSALLKTILLYEIVQYDTRHTDKPFYKSDITLMRQIITEITLRVIKPTLSELLPPGTPILDENGVEVGTKGGVYTEAEYEIAFQKIYDTYSANGINLYNYKEIAKDKRYIHWE